MSSNTSLSLSIWMSAGCHPLYASHSPQGYLPISIPESLCTALNPFPQHGLLRLTTAEPISTLPLTRTVSSENHTPFFQICGGSTSDSLAAGSSTLTHGSRIPSALSDQTTAMRQAGQFFSMASGSTTAEHSAATM